MTIGHRRRAFATLAIAALLLVATFQALPTGALAQGSEARAWEALSGGGVVLFRHANAPGGGDPGGMRIGDCATQRNLDAAGREQARRIGEAFAGRGIAVGAVLTSQWCRTRETAALAFPGRGADEKAFNSFFADRGAGPTQTAAARAILARRAGPQALVVVTHQVNITALTGIFPASGEGIVLMRDGDGWQVAGRIRP
ncbi:MAG: histidine phosphatase family protein [Phreatobacter sp.]|uniref:histidine phosphatase family protein n=1 Tax=Phreatobacter sp. TaxID=1966341 RepID=UPI002736023C|nr:histidine phosphatase family protein [Phreatobacter sp.]MDP2803293.1 histidine phosphatase family protein [Phreatobacter sp.]